MNKLIFSAVLLACAAGPSHAAGDTGLRNILEYGCHKNDGTCYFSVDGPAVSGGPGCVGNNIRWDSLSGNGKHWLALIMLAKAQNKRIALNISGCYGVFPTFDYGNIER